MKKLLKYAGLLILPIAMFVSCDEESYPDTTQYLTQITSIKIVNGGLTGTEVIEGTVNENTKKISFPEVHMESDLSKVKFEITATDGRAHLDSLEYDFVVAEGYSERTRTIKLVNDVRYREYYVTIKLDVPVWGADFTKPTVYDFTGAKIYADLKSANTRQSDMDGQHVLMVSRDGGNRPHLLRISDLKQGKIEPIMLSMTGVSGGTFAISGGRLAQGRVYICNMATPPAGAVKIYYWETPTSEPQLLYSLTDQLTYAGGRFGDFLSVDIDASGNGYIFMGVNGNIQANKVVRLKVTNFTTVSDPAIVNPTGAGDTAAYAGLWAAYNGVDGVANEYLYSGHQSEIRLVDEKGDILYKIPASTIPVKMGSDARIINFNNERYLVANEVPGTGSITVYDITVGENTVDALSKMSGTPVYKFSLGGAVAAGTAAGSIGWYADGTDKLYLYGGAPGAGFAIVELPKKVKE
jgi:hypothetical protein